MVFIKHECNLKNYCRNKYWGLTGPVDWSDRVSPTTCKLSKAQSRMLQVTWSLWFPVYGLLSHQDPVLKHYGGLIWGEGLNPLQMCSWRILLSKLTRQRIKKVLIFVGMYIYIYIIIIKMIYSEYAKMMNCWAKSEVISNCRHINKFLLCQLTSLFIWQFFSECKLFRFLNSIYYACFFYVCVCVCVCEREREREREREMGRGRMREWWERERVCVCVCVCERERERECVVNMWCDKFIQTLNTLDNPHFSDFRQTKFYSKWTCKQQILRVFDIFRLISALTQ